MPKISNNDVTIHNDDISKTYKVVIFYNQDYAFYTSIIDEFTELSHHLSDEERTRLFIRKNSKSKSDIITGGTESECLSRAKKAMEIFVTSSVVKRDVIILFYESDRAEINYSGMKYNDKHPQIAMRLGLVYACESSVGDKKVYSTFRKWSSFNGEEHSVRQELSLWNKHCNIIPDTAGNREALESLYKAFELLKERLNGFTATPETLLDLIQSKTKLLS